MVVASLTAAGSSGATFVSFSKASPTTLETQRGQIAAAALSSAPVVELASSYASFETVPLRRASDGQSISLPSVWGGGKVVVAFLRHFG